MNLRMEKRPCKRPALSIGALMGYLEGVRLLRLEKKEYALWVFSWTQRTLKVKSGSSLEL